jgi:hypothetical protein
MNSMKKIIFMSHSPTQRRVAAAYNRPWPLSCEGMSGPWRAGGQPERSGGRGKMRTVGYNEFDFLHQKSYKQNKCDEHE